MPSGKVCQSAAAVRHHRVHEMQCSAPQIVTFSRVQGSVGQGIWQYRFVTCQNTSIRCNGMFCVYYACSIVEAATEYGSELGTTCNACTLEGSHRPDGRTQPLSMHSL
jgi:hypothetical protein